MPSTSDQLSDPFPLKTLSESGKPPKSRLDSATKAQEIYANIHKANELRNILGTVIQGMFDGNPPYNNSKLRQHAQGWRANFNTLEGKARKDSAKTPYYDLFTSAQLFADCFTEKKSDTLKATEASRIIAQEFDRMLRSWPGFDLNVWQMLDDFVGFGRGWLLWLDELSWYFKRIHWLRVMFPDGTSVDTEEWGMFVVEHIFDPTRLNSYVKDEANARSRGWNVEQVRRAIRNAVPADPNTMQDEMAVQQAIRDQDIYITTRAKTIQAASIFVREFDGSWSRMMVQTNYDGKNELKDGDWLYFKQNVAEKSVHEILAPFFFEVENGSVNGLGGLGRDIFDTIKAKDRMRCEQVNNVFMRSTLLLQGQDASSMKKASQITVGGGVTLIPPGLNLQQSTMLGDIESTMVVNQDLDRMLDVNTGIYRPSFEKPAGNPETATAAQLRFAQATVLTTSAVNRFYQQLDRFYQEVFRRATMPIPKGVTDTGMVSAREFQDRCREKGVSKEQLSNCIVRAMRAIGNGSPAMRQQNVAAVAEIAPSFGQRGFRNWMQDYVAAFGGQPKVDLYLPKEDEANLPSEQDREAMQENAVIKIGSPVLVIENDNHPVHLGRHFEAAFAALAAVQEGAPPEDAFAFVQGVVPHIQEHLQQTKREDIRKVFEQQLKELVTMFREVQGAVQEQQQAMEQQQRVMSELELRNVETQAKLQERAVKTQAGLQDKAMKTQQNMALADATTAAAIAREGAMTTAKIMSERAKAAAAKERGNAKTKEE